MKYRDGFYRAPSGLYFVGTYEAYAKPPLSVHAQKVWLIDSPYYPNGGPVIEVQELPEVARPVPATPDVLAMLERGMKGKVHGKRH